MQMRSRRALGAIQSIHREQAEGSVLFCFVLLQTLMFFCHLGAKPEKSRYKCSCVRCSGDLCVS